MKTNRHILFVIVVLLFACLLLTQSRKLCTPIVETIEKEKIVEVHTRDTAIVTKNWTIA